MSYLPALLVRTEEELAAKLSHVTVDIEEFMETTGQEHHALHVDIILPEFGKTHSSEPTLAYDILLTSIIARFEGERLRLNIHLMGQADEALAVAQWILANLNDTRVYGEIYLPFYSYDNLELVDHRNWLVGTWYDKSQWDLETEFVSGEILLMTVLAGHSGQVGDTTLKQSAHLVADKHPEYNWIFDGGWKKDESPLEDNREIAVNTDYWSTLH
jgi:hypothetical protein